MFQVIETDFGPLEACWTALGLYSCKFVCKESDAPVKCMPSAQTQRLSKTLRGYFKTGGLVWDLDSLDWTGVTEFQQVALRACYEIPAGSTVSYGRLAASIGRPKAARAIGMAMARNRWPIVIPCHRVLGANGKLTGYSGSGGLATKRSLLRLEGRQLNIDFEFPVG